MSYQIPTTEPTQVTAGDTLKWSRSLSDYPASAGWTLNYSLLSLAGSIQIASVASGSDHAVTVAAADSAAYVPGTYTWQSWVTNGSERYQINRGTIEILPDFSATATGALDTRSHVKRVLDSIEAVIEGRASKGDLKISIDGTALEKMSAESILLVRTTYLKEYRRELQKERQAQGKNSGRKIVTRFTR